MRGSDRRLGELRIKIWQRDRKPHEQLFIRGFRYRR
jgi:hypothetical protein